MLHMTKTMFLCVFIFIFISFGISLAADEVRVLNVLDVYYIEDYGDTIITGSMVEICGDRIYVADEMRKDITVLKVVNGQLHKDKDISFDYDEYYYSLNADGEKLLVATTKNLYIYENEIKTRIKNMTNSIGAMHFNNNLYYFGGKASENMMQYNNMTKKANKIYELKMGKYYSNDYASHLVYTKIYDGNIYILSRIAPSMEIYNINTNKGAIRNVSGLPKEKYEKYNMKNISKIGKAGVPFTTVFYALDIDERNGNIYAVSDNDNEYVVCEISNEKTEKIGKIKIVDQNYKKAAAMLQGFAVGYCENKKYYLITSRINHGIIVNVFESEND